ncbi:hypothetical protein VTI28DRAFT_7780 [Corynascus sepedonium]
MSIQRLPGDVAAQIKSSAVITSLNTAVCGLLQNALDAGASKVNISVDHSRGNCSVEDNGVGIEPANFREDGGLGKVHYTSKYPPRPDCHGKRGEFLAALAALSLLSITSRHRDFTSHNILIIHNSRVLARNLPAPPEQRVLTFASGTRVIVRDLFGSMPVRVRQRAIEVERAGTSRDFDRLIFKIVALLLPWPAEVAVSVQDSCARRTVSLQISGMTGWSEGYPTFSPLTVARTTRLLAAASLVDRDNLKSWVPIEAAASGISVRGCVSLQPAATKRVQFIAIGVHPLLNNHRSTPFYDDVNRVFEASSFGVIEEAVPNQEGRPVKTEGFLSKEVKSKRGVDRWPMFFLQVFLGKETAEVDVDEYLDTRHQDVAIIADLLQVMAYEFLRKHQFRPKPTTAIQRLKRSRTKPLGGMVSQRSGPANDQRVRTGQQRLRSHSAERQSVSPFVSWAKTKPTVMGGNNSKQMEPGSRGIGKTFVNMTASSEEPLSSISGAIQRKQSNDADDQSEAASGENSVDETPSEVQAEPQLGTARDTVVWVNPANRLRDLIYSRTMRPNPPGKARFQFGRKQNPRKTSQARKRKSVSGTDQSTIFQPVEPPIPQIILASEALGCKDEEGNTQSKGFGGLTVECPDEGLLPTLEGRISKTALQKAEVVAQVDQKFILAKVSTAAASAADSMLILIDQHAADERCKVEGLLDAYFIPDPAGNGHLMAQTQSIDQPLRFELSGQEGGLLVQFQGYFTHWGIVYEVLYGATIQDAATVVVRALPSSVSERCRVEPRLLIDMLRKAIWRLHSTGSGSSVRPLRVGRDDGWVARFHDCPDGLLDLINSRACRSAIMFNDRLTLEHCSNLVRQLAACAFPFQCAHGRPSMVPLVRLGQETTSGSRADRVRRRRAVDGVEEVEKDLKR